jgi:hypothetical protein
MPARILSTAGNVEYLLHPATKLKIYERYENNRVRRQLHNTNKRESVSEIENIANTELTKISKWARNER